ncbi:hypothetical protein DFP72DRAFT_782495, partial [Ephemerocybe angulata]
ENSYVQASHVVISKELQSRIGAYILSEPNIDTQRTQTLFDSACSAHMTPNSHWLLPETISHLQHHVNVHLGDDSIIKGVARGTMRYYVNRSRNEYVEFTRVLLVPELSTTLISIPQLARAGFDTLF